MIKIPLSFKFKGSRDYIHGTDMYNLICSNASGAIGGISSSFRMVIHSFARKQCDMLFSEPGEAVDKPEHAATEFSFTYDNGRIFGWLVESDRPVEDRYSYDESKIEKLCSIHDDAIVITGNSNYTPIEVVVSMTKQLHYALYPANGKWIFTKLELKRLFRPEDATNVRIELKHNLNNRLTKSAIISNGEIIGWIYFSLL